MNKDIKKIVYLGVSFVSVIVLVKLNQFNIFSYLVGTLLVYLSRWAYNG